MLTRTVLEVLTLMIGTDRLELAYHGQFEPTTDNRQPTTVFMAQFRRPEELLDLFVLR